VKKRVTDERGAVYVEYAFLVALIAMVCLLSVVYFGTQTSDHVERSGNSVAEATG
jgi:Flp pilus assembly pilin Flp